MEEESSHKTFPVLPLELVRSICALVESAAVLVAIERLCTDWRAAVDDEVWRRVTLRRFPNVKTLIEVLSVARPCYRSIYRDQLCCRSAKWMPMPLSVNERLRKFAFSIKLALGDEEWNWTGCLQETPAGADAADVVLECVGCRVWDASDPPEWVADLLAAWDDGSDAKEQACAEQYEYLARNLRLSMCVTKATTTGTRSLCLAEALAPDIDTFQDNQIGFGHVGEFFDLLPQLPFFSVDCLHVFAGHEEIPALDLPRIRPWLDARRGIVDGIFCEPGDPGSFVKAESVADYLERFAPW